MNIGPLIVLFKLYESLGPVSPIGPPEPPKDRELPKDEEFKPTCPRGYFAHKNPKTGLWSCKLIPGGR